ncbi:MAG: phosphoesterase [Nanoarchaeota archaeon]|nr:phosphoesterase [Nanoarchaeota archaeon]|tara:strand:+ start:4251 stop:4937 length:687 start_codon:yes stop_codon:yes gene_type:complete
MNIHNNIEMRDLSLVYKDHLIISDLHIGLEEALNKQGILIPRFQFEEIKTKLKKILTKEIKTVVVNGDLKHEFGTISEQEWRHTLEVLDLCLENNRNVILVKGNHDTILDPIAEKKNLEILEEYVVDDITIIHGNKLKEIKTKIIIIGHEHPAIRVQDNIRTESYKCFLKGDYKDKTLIIIPSFSLVTQGTNILTEKDLSPFYESRDNFEVFIVGDKIYSFGKIKDLI